MLMKGNWFRSQAALALKQPEKKMIAAGLPTDFR